MIQFLHFHPITTAAVIIFALSLWKGGAAERLGAAMMVAEWLLETGVDQLAHTTFLADTKLIAVTPTVFCDFLLAAGLLCVALRFGKLWLGIAMILQGVMLAMHALTLGYDAPGESQYVDGPAYNFYVMVLNIVTCLLLLSLLSGTLSAWRRRALRRRRPAPAGLQPAAA